MILAFGNPISSILGTLSVHIKMFPPPQHPIDLGRGWYFRRGNPAYPSYPSNWIDLYGPGASKRLILECRSLRPI
jgi:hypothetical protein